MQRFSIQMGKQVNFQNAAVVRTKTIKHIVQECAVSFYDGQFGDFLIATARAIRYVII